MHTRFETQQPGTLPAGIDRRTEQRLETSIPVNLWDSALVERPYQGRLENISPGGFMVRVDRNILPGVKIRVMAENRLFLGAVVHSTLNSDGFQVGAKIEAMVVVDR